MTHKLNFGKVYLILLNMTCYGEECRRSSNYWLQLICNRKREKFDLTNLFNTQNNMYSHFKFWNSYQDTLKYNTKFTKYYSKINHTMFTTISLTWQQNPLNSFTWQFFSNSQSASSLKTPNCYPVVCYREVLCTLYVSQ